MQSYRVSFIILAGLFLLTACSPQTNVEVEQNSAIPAEETLPSPTPEPTIPPTLVPAPIPTNAPQQTVYQPGPEIFASEEINAVIVEIRQALIGTKADFASQGITFLDQEEYSSSDIVAKLEFGIASNNEKRVQIFPSKVILDFNGEQVNISEWWNEIFATPCGHIYPGVHRTGTIWFNINTLAIQDISEMFVDINTKVDDMDYYLVLDLADTILGNTP